MIMIDNRKKVGKFILHLNESLGKGNYGKVVCGFKDGAETIPLAIKMICLNNMSEMFIQNIVKEIETHKKLTDACPPNIVNLFEVFRTTNSVYMVMERCEGGNLQSYIEKNGYANRLGEREVRSIIVQLVEGFKVMRAKKIIHRDIKRENVLMSDGVWKIADFGFSRELINQFDRAMTIVGSPVYMAPELLEFKEYNHKCDIWSFGVLLYSILYGRFPWEPTKNTWVEFAEQIAKEPLDFPQVPYVSQPLKDLLQKMLCKREEERCDWDELFLFRWVESL